MRCIGKGVKGAQMFSTVMNMPPPVTNFQRYNSKLHKAATVVCDRSVKAAADSVKSLQNYIPEEKESEAAVTIDGTWMKRGHTSNFGVVTVIDAGVGKVLDYEVLSKYCHACKLNKKRD